MSSCACSWLLAVFAGVGSFALLVAAFAYLSTTDAWLRHRRRRAWAQYRRREKARRR